MNRWPEDCDNARCFFPLVRLARRSKIGHARSAQFRAPIRCNRRRQHFTNQRLTTALVRVFDPHPLHHISCKSLSRKDFCATTTSWAACCCVPRQCVGAEAQQVGAGCRPVRQQARQAVPRKGQMEVLLAVSVAARAWRGWTKRGGCACLDRLDVGPHHIGNAAGSGVAPQVVQRELALAPAVSKGLIAMSRAILLRNLKQWTTVRAALKTGALTPSMFRRSTPSARASSDMRTTRMAGWSSRGVTMCCGMAIQTSNGARVPISWTRNAESRQTTPLGTRAKTGERAVFAPRSQAAASCRNFGNESDTEGLEGQRG